MPIQKIIQLLSITIVIPPQQMQNREINKTEHVLHKHNLNKNPKPKTKNQKFKPTKKNQKPKQKKNQIKKQPNK